MSAEGRVLCKGWPRETGMFKMLGALWLRWPRRAQLCWSVLDYWLADWIFEDITLAREAWGKLLGWSMGLLQGDCLEQYQCEERRMYKSENECRFFNICVILASLKMFFHIHHLLYHLNINVGWVYYEPSTVQDTRVQISNEIDMPSALPKNCRYNSVRWADQEWSVFQMWKQWLSKVRRLAC